MKASSSIPFVCKPYTVQGKSYYDGALGDPVPVEKAFQHGCDRVVVILTKPEHELRSPGKDEKLAVHIRKKYPSAAEKLCLRAQQYNESVALAKEYAGQGKVLIVSPDDTCGVDTLKKDKESLKRLYEKGYKDGGAVSIPGKRPYKKSGGAGLVPKPNKDCVRCGLCAERCPVQAIN